MNTIIESLNHWGEIAVSFAWPMFWQSSLLIALLLAMDFVLRNKLRATVRYALWLLVLVKLVLPPSFALATSLAWWLRPVPTASPSAQTHTFTVTHDGDPLEPFREPLAIIAPESVPGVSVSVAGCALLAWGGIGAALLLWMLARWHRVIHDLRRSSPPPASLAALLDEAKLALGVRHNVRLRLIAQTQSPAVCGLLRPAILLPRLLVERLASAQMRAVLLHELIHLRRRDVWVNCAQALLQVVYWWHPLLWLANNRIRRAREEAVDDAVMLALRNEAETYAPTLLEVAKLALRRPLASLGLIGILESKTALRQRVERLIDFRSPSKCGLTFVSCLGILAFAAAALPMGEPAHAPQREGGEAASVQQPPPEGNEGSTTGAPAIRLRPRTTDRIAEDRGGIGPRERSLRAAFVFPGASSRRIAASLETLRVEQISFQREPLGRVLHRLNEESRLHHLPEKEIPFVISAEAEGRGQLREISSVAITIDPPLTNASFASILAEVAKGASRPIQYAITDRAVIFSLAEEDASPLHTRRYKLSADALQRSLGRGKQSTEAPDYRAALDKLMRDAGVDIQPPKSMYLKESLLMVRATLRDLDVIERILSTVMNGPQVHIDARFVETTPGMDHHIKTLVRTLTEATKDSVAADQVWSSIVTTPQSRVLLRALDQQPGTETLAEPAITTLPGRQAQVQTVDIRSVARAINPDALIPPGVSSSNLFTTENLICGPVLDIVPALGDDGETLQLTLRATLTEFLGYETSVSEPVHVYVDGVARRERAPNPMVRVRTFEATQHVRGGQTLVLGNPTITFANAGNSTDPKGKQPEKSLLLFVTPRLLDSAGQPW